MLEKLFLAHPRSVGESYFEHMAQALRFAGLLFLGGLACVIHALLPLTFRHTGSGIVRRLYRKMVVMRHRQPRRI